MRDSLYVSSLPALRGWGRLSLWDLSSPLSDSMLQFPDTVEFSEEMANLGKTVIVAALDATFQRKPFGNILSLVPLAESVVKLHAVCMQCYREAAYTKRIGVEKEVEVIGGADKYQAVCRTCYGGQEDKENTRRTPIRAGKEVEASLPRKVFSHLHL
uniref:Thymidine kinase n=1 Tax=Oryzias sinensis TaxID=183150 RepID=A0A8C7X6T1_9TELE